MRCGDPAVLAATKRQVQPCSPSCMHSVPERQTEQAGALPRFAGMSRLYMPDGGVPAPPTLSSKQHWCRRHSVGPHGLRQTGVRCCREAWRISKLRWLSLGIW